MTVAETWNAMLVQQPRARITRRLTGDPQLGAVATVSGRANLAGLIIETGVRGGGPSFPNFESIRMEYIEESPDWDAGCILELRDPSLMDNFVMMANQILDAVEGVTEAQGRIDAIHGNIRSWLRIFKRQSSPLSSERQRGLFVELHVLNRHLRPRLGDTAALAAWHGPDGSTHDFTRGDRAIECKAHATLEPHIHVHGSDQLDWHSAEHLWLFAAEVREDDGGTTLPELVDSIAEAIHQTDQEQFMHKLSQAGYFREHAPSYQTAMEIGQVRCYEVQPGFPALVDPPQGVTSVIYILDLNHAAPFTVSENDALGGFAA